MAKFGRQFPIPLLWLLVAEFAVGINVKLELQDNYVILDNGVVQMTLSKPGGMVTGVRYNGIDNLLETRNEEDNRGYWSVFWNEPGGEGRGPNNIDNVKCNEFKVILENEKQVEISFTRTWNFSLKGVIPLNIDRRYIMLKDSPGFYTYSIFEHLNGWPDFNLNLTRVAYKLDKQLFRYMAVDEKRQRRMPLPDDREEGRGEPLAYKEAVHLIKPIEQEFTGEVDDKYMYSSEIKDIKVHGWVAENISSGPSVGFWHITPSYEYRSAGPFKQELSSHVGPTSLTVFLSAHSMGQELVPMFRNGEPWKKVYGPIFIYLNSGPPGTKLNTLWKDANNQLKKEIESWPYSFPVSDDFPKAKQRGSVRGRLLVRDRYINKEDIPADSAYVGLALPGEAGSWQKESKGYQFWTQAGADGSFLINNVRAGVYNLYATFPGFVGDYKSDVLVKIPPGSNIDLGDSVYMPPRTGPTLWKIGYPDRSAAEFFVPNPDPSLVTPLFNTLDGFRQYGLWDRYTISYPKVDLVYRINSSDYRKDWFYAHLPRKNETSYQATTWQIRFTLDNVVPNGMYTLRLAIASAQHAKLEIRFNVPNAVQPHFTTGGIGRDNAIARHGIHGLYWLFNIEVKSSWLIQGDNTIFITQTEAEAPFKGVMYDYIRFEGPSVSLDKI